MNGNDFSTCMPYMARDRIYYTEKPYTVDFTPENGEAASNHVGDHRQIIVHNIPPASRDAFHLDVHGFCVLKAKTKLSAAEALMSTRTVQQAYAEEVEDLLHNTFPEYSRIETMNVVVRKPNSIQYFNVGKQSGLSWAFLRCENETRGFLPTKWPSYLTTNQPASRTATTLSRTGFTRLITHSLAR